MVDVPESGRIRVKTWEELYALPRYVSVISKDEVTLGKLRGPYGMQDQRKEKCAIKECRTPHWTGRIVQLGDGRLTGIGHRCGKKYFPDQWTDLIRESNVQDAAENARAVVLSMQVRAEELLARLGEIRQDIDKHYKLKAQFEKNVPASIVDEVRARASRSDSTIVMSRKLSEREREIARATGQASAKYGVEDRVIGNIAGLAIFQTNNDLVQIAEQQIRPICQRGARGEPDKKLPKYVADCAPLLDRINRVLFASSQFFAEDNLKQLLRLAKARAVRLEDIGVNGLGDIYVKRSDVPIAKRD